MKKLAIITSHLIQYQIPLFKSLQKKRIDTHVFFASKHGLNSKYKDPEFLVKLNWNINADLTSGFKSYFPKIQKFRINDFRLSFADLEKHFKNKRFDAVLILGWNNLHYLKAIYLAKKHNIKIILRSENNLSLKNFFFKKLLKLIIFRFFFKNFNYFLSIGKLNKKFYMYHNVNKKKILDAPYFVDNKFFNISSNSKKLKRKLSLNFKNIVLFVGKLNNRKRPIDFIKLAKLNKSNKNIYFLIIGDGTLKKQCINLIKENKLNNISIKGFLNQTQLRKIYNISNLLIQTSSYETWGLTINEAMASGVPVLCTKECGAYHDLIKGKKTGLYYSVGDIFELNKKMNFILNNKSKFKKSNIQKTISYFSVEKTINSICKILYEKKI